MNEIERVAALDPAATKFCKTRDKQIAYIECGNPAGEPLLLLHGFPDSPIAWNAVIRHLDIANLRIVAPYLRGYGATLITNPELISAEAAALVEDLLELADALSIDTFHLAGHDWGAKTSYAAAVLAPKRLRSLSVLATAYSFWNGGLYPPAQVHGNWYQFYFQVDAAQKMLGEHAREFCRELWQTWSPGWHFSEGDFEAASQAWNNPQFATIVLNYYRTRWKRVPGNRRYAKNEAVLDSSHKPTINVPAVFIQGANDACDLAAGADEQAKYFAAGYERVILPDCGHFPHREQPLEVAKHLRRSIDTTRV